MTGLARIPISGLVVEGRAKVPASVNKIVWNLNLDQIEPDTGRVLEKQAVDLSDVGPSTYPFEAGTVLYSKLRPYLNKVVIADDSGYATTELVPLRCDSMKVIPAYLAYFLRSPEFLGFAKTVVAGAKMPRMVMSEFWRYEVPVPPLPEQRRIAAILDQAEALRTKRRAALAKLDTLTQSIFMEMFGDPVANPKGLPTMALMDVCKRVTDGTHQPPKWASDGIPFLFISNIVDGQIDFQTHKFISEQTHQELTERCPIEIGDVLYSTVGSYGNAAVVETTKKFAFQRHIAQIKPDNKRINSLFLAALIQSPGVRQQVDKVARGIAQKTVNLSDLKDLVIFCPPLKQQNIFAQHIATMGHIKTAHGASLTHLDALFASLQRSAFRGEL